MAHIVLVEDEPELSVLVTQALQEVGHTVEPYFDGETALKSRAIQARGRTSGSAYRSRSPDRRRYHLPVLLPSS